MSIFTIVKLSDIFLINKTNFNEKIKHIYLSKFKKSIWIKTAHIQKVYTSGRA